MTRVPHVAATAALALSAAALAQAPARELGTSVRITDRPVVLQSTKPREKEVELGRLPDKMLNLFTYSPGVGNHTQWKTVRTPPSTPNTIGSDGGALYVKRTALVGAGGQCHQTTDYIWVDYRGLAREFRLSRATMEPLPMSHGYRAVHPGRLKYHRVNSKENNILPGPEGANAVSVDAPQNELKSAPGLPPFTICEAGYRLRLWVKGPPGVSPYTGRPYQQVN